MNQENKMFVQNEQISLDTRNRGRNMDNSSTRIKDLLYIESQIITKIHNEIEEILRGRGRSNNEIRESIDYTLDERFAYLQDKEGIKTEKIKG